LAQIQIVYEDLKEALLVAGAALIIPIPLMIEVIDQNSRVRRMSRQMVKSLDLLSELMKVTELYPSELTQISVDAEGRKTNTASA
jgi:hypothetical protein